MPSQQSDRRKLYPMGTRASVTLDAHTDEPQTAARGREFQNTFAAAAVEARDLIASRLRAVGYEVSVKVTDADCEGWFPVSACGPEMVASTGEQKP